MMNSSGRIPRENRGASEVRPKLVVLKIEPTLCHAGTDVYQMIQFCNLQKTLEIATLKFLLAFC
jgi:hypothetical protein